MLATLFSLVADLLVVVGLLTLTIAVYGVVRMPDFFTRLQAASKPVGLGVIPILLVAMIAGGPGTIGQIVLTAFFLLVTTPVSAHIIARAAYLEREQPESPAATAGSRPLQSGRRARPSD